MGAASMIQVGDVQGVDELLGDGVAGKNAIQPPGADLALRVVGIVAAAPRPDEP